MSLTEPARPSPRTGYGFGALVVAFMLGVGLMVVLNASGLLDQGRKAIATSIAGKGLVPIDALRYDEREKLRTIAAKAASDLKKPLWQVSVKDLQKRAEIKALGLEGAASSMELQAALAPAAAGAARPANLEGYTPVDFADAKNPVLNYSILDQPLTPNAPGLPPGGPVVKSIRDAYGGKTLGVYKLQITRKPQTDPSGKPLPGGESQTVTFGPIVAEKLDQQMTMVQSQVEVKKLPIGPKGETHVPARLYSNREGKLALVIEGKVDNVTRIVSQGPIAYYPISVSELQAYMKEREKDPSKPLPPAESAILAIKG